MNHLANIWRTPSYDYPYMSHDNIFRYLTLVSHLGLTMVSCILAGFGIGFFLDKYFVSSPIWTLIFLIIGILAGFWSVYKVIIKEIDKK